MLRILITNTDQANSIVPKMFRKVEIKYSKYGVEDFNFRHYNQTPFSGLEIHIQNAYCNCMIQVHIRTYLHSWTDFNFIIFIIIIKIIKLYKII